MPKTTAITSHAGKCGGGLQTGGGGRQARTAGTTEPCWSEDRWAQRRRAMPQGRPPRRAAWLVDSRLTGWQKRTVFRRSVRDQTSVRRPWRKAADHTLCFFLFRSLLILHLTPPYQSSRMEALPLITSHGTGKKKGRTMAEPQETRQEQEARWATQRTTRDKAFQAGQHARQSRNRRIWLIVTVIVIIIAVIAAVVLL